MRQVQKDVADLILQAQADSGMTQKDFARHIGISTKALAYWKTGKRIPRDLELIDKALYQIGKTIVLGEDR